MLHLINVTGTYINWTMNEMTDGYVNPSLTVDGILVSEDEILLIRRKAENYVQVMMQQKSVVSI